MKAQTKNDWINQAMKQFKAVCQRLQEQLSAAGDGAMLNAAEQSLKTTMAELTKQIQQKALQEELDKRTKSQRYIICPMCGCKMRHKGYHTRSFISQLGHIQLRGPYRYCRCGNSRTIGELVSGLSNIASGLLELVLRYCAAMPFAEVSKYIAKDFGLRLSDEYIRQISLDYGQKVAGLRDKHQAGGRWELSEKDLYGYADGVMINIRSEGWKECRLLRYEASLDRRARLRAVLGNSEKFGRIIRREAIGIGASSAKQIVFVMDAALGFSRQVNKNIPAARQIIDYWHVCQHIAECAMVLYGPSNRSADDWRSICCRLLREQGPGLLLDKLQRVHSRFHKQSKRWSVTKLMKFIKRHRNRIEYPSFIAEGLKVDSGPVESSCKGVVQHRLKGPGMRWSRKGAISMLELRTALFSDLWEDTINALSA